MGARQRMTMRATIERDQQAAEDPWGHPENPDWQTHLDRLPCSMWVHVETDVTDDNMQAVVEDRRAIFPLDTDLTPTDRIAQVADRRGQVLFDGPMRIRTVVRRADHLEVLVDRSS